MTKQINIPATLRIHVADDISDKDLAKLVSTISSDTLPTLEEVASELARHVNSISGNPTTSSMYQNPSVWVDDSYEES